MAAKELIEKLSKYPSDTLVLVQGYEGGFSDIVTLKKTKVELNSYKEDWNGPHEETTDSNNSAVLILRTQ
jgi:hypothetical protein